ncbi:MAG: hypothetical protein R3F37_13035 [Candidatus Competibacteraceae bacterium]
MLKPLAVAGVPDVHLDAGHVAIFVGWPHQSRTQFDPEGMHIRSAPAWALQEIRATASVFK